MTATWNEITNENPDIIWVTHHSGFKYDEFTTPESIEYEWFYEGTPFAPGSMLDRTNMSKYGGNLISYPGNKSKFKYYVSICSKVEPKVSLAIDKKYNSSTRMLEITVSGNVLEEIPESSRMTVYLTEDGLKGHQFFSETQKYTEYVHSHVLRYVLSNLWGDEIKVEDGKFSNTYSFTIPEKNKPENMHVVAFVSNYNPDDKTNCEVLNSEIATLADSTTAISDVSHDDVNVRAFANAGKIVVTGRYKSFDILSQNGIKVRSISSGNMYLVRIDTGNAIVTRKVIAR